MELHITNACTRQSLLSHLVLAHKLRQIGEAPNALASEANVGQADQSEVIKSFDRDFFVC